MADTPPTEEPTEPEVPEDAQAKIEAIVTDWVAYTQSAAKEVAQIATDALVLRLQEVRDNIGFG